MSTQKTALVTGGSSGIGQGTAIVLAEQGYDVAITYSKNNEGALKTQAQIEALGRRCFIHQASLEDPETPQRLVDAVHQELGHIDLLVNNAGRDSRVSALTATIDDLRYIVETNFYGYCLMASAVARTMVLDEVKGCIIFITSTRGESAHPDDFIYGGIKAAINRACQSMALELSRYGIRVNCVAPGATRVRDVKGPRRPTSSTWYPLEPSIPMGRLGLPRDNGELIAFLASDKAGYITGTVIRVDGGLVLPGTPEFYAPSQWINEEWAKRHEDNMRREYADRYSKE